MEYITNKLQNTNLNTSSYEKELHILNSSILTDINDFDSESQLQKYLDKTYNRYERYLLIYNIPTNIIKYIKIFLQDFQYYTAQDTYLFDKSKNIDKLLLNILVLENKIFFDLKSR